MNKDKSKDIQSTVTNTHDHRISRCTIKNTREKKVAEPKKTHLQKDKKKIQEKDPKKEVGEVCVTKCYSQKNIFS